VQRDDGYSDRVEGKIAKSTWHKDDAMYCCIHALDMRRALSSDIMKNA
jgi:hypothetical protein